MIASRQLRSVNPLGPSCRRAAPGTGSRLAAIRSAQPSTRPTPPSIATVIHRLRSVVSMAS